MDCMGNCWTATQDTLGACFTSIGSGLGSASDCISSNCGTLATSIGNGCSALGRGLSDCCGSFTTCLTGFVTGPLWSCMQSTWSAVSSFFANGLTWMKENPIRVIDFSIGCVAGVATAILMTFCFNRFCKSNESHPTPLATPLLEIESKREPILSGPQTTT